jgi:hypothetical protein
MFIFSGSFLVFIETDEYISTIVCGSGMDPGDQAGVDKLLSEESSLAGVAREAVSLAVCKAGAKQANQVGWSARLTDLLRGKERGTLKWNR